MKLIKISLLLLLFVACSSKKTLSSENKKHEAQDQKITEGAVASKKVPKKVAGFSYVSEVNAYFKNSVSKKKRQRIISKIKKKKKLIDKKSRFSRQLKAKTKLFKYPLWSDYFADRDIHGTIDLNMLIGKDGFAEIIIVKQGIDPKVNRIFVSYAAKFPFKAAIHKKSKKPVRAWYRFRSSF